ncbi:DUF4835 family protein [Flavobacterium tegetincola]|uniref:type IX secretion system protein PorD n=1 Tax=Flavobacterium tegetincola TaxID=150172 RepID=UPI000420FAC9|nr:DUF4835 family protein [Flavobacterium tegetincola]
MTKLFSIIVLFCCFAVQAQELNCIVKINAQSLTNSNQPIFKTLETSLTDFVNKTRWTNKKFKQSEKIDCTIFINVTSYGSDQFVATLQVASSRTAFGSSYISPVLNYNDKDFNFKYVEFENLIFNPNSFDSNLVAVVAFYAYIIIGLDADTYELNAGKPFYQQAQEVVNLAQQSSYKGWSQNDGGSQNRFFLTNDLMSGTFDPIKSVLYNYHINGLDLMSESPSKGKEGMKTALLELQKIHSIRPNSFLTRLFFDAKSDEILSVFSGGPQVKITDLVDNLNRVSPLNSSKWATIRF